MSPAGGGECCACAAALCCVGASCVSLEGTVLSMAQLRRSGGCSGTAWSECRCPVLCLTLLRSNGRHSRHAPDAREATATKDTHAQQWKRKGQHSEQKGGPRTACQGCTRGLRKRGAPHGHTGRV